MIPNFLNFGEDDFCPEVAGKFRENDMGCYIGNNCGGELGVIVATLAIVALSKFVVKSMTQSK
jgi:hypothetical protein